MTQHQTLTLLVTSWAVLLGLTWDWFASYYLSEGASLSAIVGRWMRQDPWVAWPVLVGGWALLLWHFYETGR